MAWASFSLRAWAFSTLRGGIISLWGTFSILEYRLVPLLVSITKIGDELSIAAVTRGLSPETKRTCVATIGFHVQDAVVFVYCMAVVLICYVFPDLVGDLLSRLT